MVRLFALLAAVAVSLLITRVATLVLVHTGLSRQSARFQARSALTGVGFTTGEAESVTKHPVRRRIVMWLMLIGNAGIITVIATVFATASQGGDEDDWLLRGLVFLAGVGALWLLTWNPWVDAALSKITAVALRRWTDIDTRDYSALLHLSNNYNVIEMLVDEKNWLADKSLLEADLQSEGVLVLGVERKEGTYLGAPRGATVIRPGDTLLIYGNNEVLEHIERKRSGWHGDKAHELTAEVAQEAIAEEEQAEAEVLGENPQRDASPAERSR